METKEIIHEIERLPIQKKMVIIEQTLRSIRHKQDKNQMEKAAELLQKDYKVDKELTAFTSLDLEDFYETR